MNSDNKDKVMNFPDEYIGKYDKSNILKDINSLPTHLLEGYKLANDLKSNANFNNIVIAGMGGSLIAGFILKSYLYNKDIPVSLNNNYDLVKECDENSLLITISYSGNTEETLSAYKEGVSRKCRIIALTRGGKLAELCKLNKTNIVRLPTGFQPRATLGFQLGALIGVMEKTGIIENAEKEIGDVSNRLRKAAFSEHAISLSDTVHNKIPLIYASEKYYPIAYRWKTQINENSKSTAFANYFPELNHNEIMSYANSSAQGNFHVIFLSSDDDFSRVQKRMKITKDIIQKRGIDVTELRIKGSTMLERLLSGVLLGDFVSYYLSLRYGTDPSPVDDIETLKEKLGPFMTR